MTSVYTFKVTMAVEVLAEDQKTAEKNLNENGGYVTERKVELMNTTTIPNVSLAKK